MASMNTRSPVSSRQFGLSTYVYGGGVARPFGSIFTIFGPNAPICSQTVAAPGPPLNRNQTGLFDLSVTLFFE